MTGPSVTIGPRATLSLSLLLHELATNALKYGALSHPSGHVNIEWKLTGDNLVFVWSESSGPAISEPTRTGFGSRLINLGLIGTGQATLQLFANWV